MTPARNRLAERAPGVPPHWPTPLQQQNSEQFPKVSNMTRAASRRLLQCSLLLLLCAPLSAVFAQDVMRLLPLSLEELINTPIVTASRRVELRDHTPAHVMVVTREQIRERRYRNLGDLLGDLPGVDFMRGTKSSSYNNFSVQGYNSNNKLLIMLDGVRIDHPAGGKIPVAENYALFMARQVEVLYGPAAALYGADAVAGVINIITDRPDPAQQSWVAVGGGRFDSREASFMAVAQPAERVALTVGGHTQRSDRAPLDHYYPADFPRVDARTFDGDIAVPANARERYVDRIASHSVYARIDLGEQFSFGHYRNAFSQPTSTGDRPDTALYRRDARWETAADTTYGRLRFDLGAELSGELLIDHARHEVDPRSRYINIYTGFEDQGYAYAKATRTGIEQSLQWQASAAHGVQMGLGYHDYEAVQTPDLPHPYRRSRGTAGQGLTHANTDLPIRIFKATYHNVFAYAQLQSDWGAHFSTMVGVRHDDHSGYGSSTNPRIGAVWRPHDQHVLKVLYGQAFRAPSPEESLSAFGTFSGARDADGRYLGSGFRAPNADIEPETARTLSLTWDWRPRPDVNLVANLYHSRIRNLIVTVDEAVPTQYIPGAVLSKTSTKDNAGEETHTGLDLIGQWRFRLGPRWSGDVWGSFSLADGKVREGRNAREWDLSYVAQRKFKLGTTFRYLDQFTVTPRLQWIGETGTGRKDPAAPGRRLKTDSYLVVGLYLGWHGLFDGRASLWLDIDNLFDARYHVAHGSAGTTFVDMPQQPRTWMATLEYRF